jgi:hypothetical protein
MKPATDQRMRNPRPPSRRFRTVLLETGFRTHRARLFRRRARLYFDRIELSGWSWTGYARCIIPLSEVERLEWDEEKMRVYFDSGEIVILALDQAVDWRHMLERGVMPTGQRSTAAASNTEMSMGDLITYTSSMG